MNIGNRKSYFSGLVERGKVCLRDACLNTVEKDYMGWGMRIHAFLAVKVCTTEKAEKELSLLYPSLQFKRNTRSGVRRRRLSVDSETSDNCEFKCSHVGVGFKTIFCTQQL